MEPNPMPSVPVDHTSDEDTSVEQAIIDLVGTLEQAIIPSSSDQVENEESSSQELTLRDCRYCLAPEAFHRDPIIAIGCKCKNELSIGHKLCLKRWFVPELLRTGEMICEVCRGPLGAELKHIILTWDILGVRSVPTVNPQVLFLLRVPPEDLDRLQVPIDTPEFFELPPHTQIAIDDLLRTLEDEQCREQIRRGEIQETTFFRAHYGVGPRRCDLLPSMIYRASQLRNHFIVMEYVPVTMDNAGEPVHAFIPRNEGPDGEMNIRIRMEELPPGGELLTCRGEMMRVPTVQDLPAADIQGGQAPDVELLLDTLSVLADLVAKDYDRTMVMLPRSMVVENIFINRAPNNITGGGPVPLAQERAPPARRQLTYGRYHRLDLFKFQIFESADRDYYYSSD